MCDKSDQAASAENAQMLLAKRAHHNAVLGQLQKQRNGRIF